MSQEIPETLTFCKSDLSSECCDERNLVDVMTQGSSIDSIALKKKKNDS